MLIGGSCGGWIFLLDMWEGFGNGKSEVLELGVCRMVYVVECGVVLLVNEVVECRGYGEFVLV